MLCRTDERCVASYRIAVVVSETAGNDMRCRNQDQPALFAVGRGAQILNPGLCAFGCAPCRLYRALFWWGEGKQDGEIFRLCLELR